MVSYLTGRGIDPAIARTYCREVRYTIGGKEYFAVGFRNDAGGWELRSDRFKGGSSPKYITTLKGCNATNDMNAVIDSSAINATNDVNAITDCPAIGAIASFHAGNDPMACESDRAMSASHASVMVFEGFIDFLSYLSLANNIHPVSDTVVLNSVVNLSKAVPFLNRLFRQRRNRTQNDLRPASSLSPQRDHRPKLFLPQIQGCQRLSDRPKNLSEAPGNRIRQSGS